MFNSTKSTFSFTINANFKKDSNAVLMLWTVYWTQFAKLDTGYSFSEHISSLTLFDMKFYLTVLPGRIFYQFFEEIFVNWK